MKRLFLFSAIMTSILCVSGQMNQWTWIGGSSLAGQAGNYGAKGVASSTNQPGSRYGAVTFKDPAGKFWLYGGTKYNNNQSLVYNDLWVFDPLTNLWTWVNGNQTFNQFAVRGTKGVASPTNQPGARERAQGWADATGNLWLFGGGNTSNDLWKYSISTGLWTWVHGGTETFTEVYGVKGVPDPANIPGSRYGGITWTDTSGNLWLFSGSSNNTLWKYDPSINQWAWMSGNGPNTTGSAYVFGTKGIADPANMPTATLYGSGWTDASGNFWLFGGYGSLQVGRGGGALNDLWKYSTATGLWTWMSGDSMIAQPATYGTKGVASASNNPGGRDGAVSWTDAAGNLWLFGGGVSGTPPFFRNDLWKYSPQAGQWTWVSGDNTPNGDGNYGTIGVSAPSNKPGSRVYAAGWSDALDRLWLFGGVRYNTAADYNDLWQYTASNAALPVKFTGFSTQLKRQTILLHWTIDREQNSREYIIERSADGNAFSPIGTIAAYGSINSASNYLFTDAAPLTGTNFYRIKEVDQDGRSIYSGTNKVSFGNVSWGFSILTNPVRQKLTVSLVLPAQQVLQLQIRDAAGHMLISRQVSAAKGSSQLLVNVDQLATGTYFLEIGSVNIHHTEAFVKQ